MHAKQENSTCNTCPCGTSIILTPSIFLEFQVAFLRGLSEKWSPRGWNHPFDSYLLMVCNIHRPDLNALLSFAVDPTRKPDVYLDHTAVGVVFSSLVNISEHYQLYKCMFLLSSQYDLLVHSRG